MSSARRAVHDGQMPRRLHKKLHEQRMPARTTAHACKATGEDAAVDEAVELALHQPRHLVPAASDGGYPRPLPVTREVQCWFAARDVPAMPAFIQFSDVAGAPAFYGPPPHGGRGVKVCRHGGGARTTADTVDREVHAEDVDEVRGYLHRHLPAVDGPAAHTKVCMYTMTPDEHIIVGTHPDHDHVVVLGGFSGHGFKMASVIGKIAADLVEHGRPSFDLAGKFRRPPLGSSPRRQTAEPASLRGSIDLGYPPTSVAG